MEPLVLTFDIGTQSIRALLARKDGSFADSRQIVYEKPYIETLPFRAEQKPDFYYAKLCEVSSMLLSSHPELVSSIICVTVTVIRDTVLCLDKDRKPLRDIILWLDKREAEFNNPFPAKMPLFALVGMTDTAVVQYKSSVCNWLMQNEPEMWKKCDKYVFLPAYLNYLMTGRLVDSIGNTIGHVPFNYKKRKWMEKSELTRCVMDIPGEKLCELVEPGETVGAINAATSAKSLIPEGIPLIATGSDKGCETLGLSVSSPGKAAISFGTSATIQIATEKYVEPQKFMPAYPAIIPTLFNPEIQIFRGYWMLPWFIRNFAHEEASIASAEGISAEEVLNRHLGEVPPGCDGLMLQPYWTAGITIPSARGTVLGFTDTHTKYHIYRAIIEGINFELMDSMFRLEKRSGTKIEELYISGGGSRSDEILQIAADMFGLPVNRIQTHEACALGSSLAGFVAMKEFGSYAEATKAMVHKKDTFVPDEKNHRLYMSLYSSVYSKLYGRVDGLYRAEKKIYR